VEHVQLAEIAALLGALGAVGALITRGGIFPLIGLALLGLATGGLGWSLVGDEDVQILLHDPAGVALIVVGVAAAVVLAVPLARYPAVVPVALLVVAPFRVPVQLGEEEAFLLLPLYLVIAAAALALAYRILRGERPPPPPFVLAIPLAAFVTLTATSFLWTWDERAGGIALAFFVFPFTAGLATVARAPVADWLPRALLVTLVALGTLFAAIGIYQAHSRTLTTLIRTVGFGIAILMGFGAVFGAILTMYTAVSTRTREIATLRALGFNTTSVVVSVLVESLALGALGGVAGGLLAYAAFNGYQTSTMNFQTFSQVAFAFAVTPRLLAEGLTYALLMALVGGLLPALKAARLPIASALREL